jgi:REP element-mobilizing transposase RayT
MGIGTDRGGKIMTHNPQQRHRRSIRMTGYDYTQPGAYFVTVCAHNHVCLFDDPVLRRVAETYWQAIPRHASHVALDAWVLMPNHLHGILIIQGPPCL